MIISEEDAKETVIISQKRTEQKLTPVTFSASEGIHLCQFCLF